MSLRLKASTVAFTLALGLSVVVNGQTGPKRIRVTPSGGGGGGTLLTVSQLTRIGAFKQPVEPDYDNWQFSSGGIAFRSSTNSLFAVVDAYGEKIYEIQIPALSMSTVYDDLNGAVQLQGPRDPFEGRINELVPLCGGQMVAQGVAVSGTNLLLAGWCFYDANGVGVYSHFTRSTTLSTGVLAQGPMTVSSPLNTAFGSGNMAEIPSSWQSALGGMDMLSGLGPVPIITRTSQGPALFAWSSASMIAGKPVARTNTAQAGTIGTITLDAGASAADDAYNNYVVVIDSGTGFGQNQIIQDYNGTTKVATTVKSWGPAVPDNTSVFSIYPPVPSIPLAYYTEIHPTLGVYQGSCGSSVMYCTADQIGGIVFIEGTRTVAVFGQHSTCCYAYGLGGPYVGGSPASSNPYLRYDPGTVIQAGDLDEGVGAENVGSHRVYDPINSAKGEHAYPYYPWVWLYDAADLALVAAGSLNPWDVVPYESAELPGMASAWPMTVGPAIWGAAYDRTNKRIYFASTPTAGAYPVFNVYSHP